ncbi:MAG: ATP-binding protein [Proteobacteria bacterium]|nr:ATP-binding protein [Pseudomonadota bacterium]
MDSCLLAMMQWGDIFADMTLSSAIIDRVMHHCTLIKINGQSYRTKNSKKGGGDTAE